jgi:hypothetical protein
MISLVDRYVYTALRRVPESLRAEIDRELRAAIEDAIEAKTAAGATRDEAVEAALLELGDPNRLADQYAGRRNYLIGPELYEIWRGLMKLLLVTVLPIVVVVTIVVQIFEDPSKVFGEAVGTFFGVGVNLAFWCTLVFAVLERTGVGRVQLGLARAGRSWHPNDLPKYEPKAMTLGQLATNLAWLAVPIAAIVLQQFTFTDEPVLDPARWSFWWPLLIAVYTLRGAYQVVVYRSAAWTRTMAAVQAGLVLLSTVPIIWLVATDRFFNPAFHQFAHLGTGDPEHWVSLTVIVVVALSAVWEIIDVVRRAETARRGLPAKTLGTGKIYTLV